MSDGPKGTDASKHDLIFFTNRRTPKVVPRGKAFTAPPSYGSQKSRRPATAAEEVKIRKGDWVQVDSAGRTPGKEGYLSKNKSLGPDKNRKKVNMSTDDKAGTTKDGGVKSKGAVNAAIVKFNKMKGKMSPEKRKKIAARLKALKQGQGMKGTLKGE